MADCNVQMSLTLVHGVCQTAARLASVTNDAIAHRALIVRKLKGLEDIIPYTSVHWHMGEKGALSQASMDSGS